MWIYARFIHHDSDSAYPARWKKTKLKVIVLLVIAITKWAKIEITYQITANFAAIIFRKENWKLNL